MEGENDRVGSYRLPPHILDRYGDANTASCPLRRGPVRLSARHVLWAGSQLRLFLICLTPGE
jgi:hypothetical protein